MRSFFYGNSFPGLLLLLVSVYLPLAGAEMLPEPLSLEKALSFADSNHPDLQLADANLALAVSERMEVTTSNDVDAYFEIAPYTSKPTTNDQFLNDSYLRFSVTKTLYDFGYHVRITKRA